MADLVRTAARSGWAIVIWRGSGAASWHRVICLPAPVTAPWPPARHFPHRDRAAGPLPL